MRRFPPIIILEGASFQGIGLFMRPVGQKPTVDRAEEEKRVGNRFETLVYENPLEVEGAKAASAEDILFFDFSTSRYVQSGPAEVKEPPMRQFPGAGRFGKVGR